MNNNNVRGQWHAAVLKIIENARENGDFDEVKTAK